MSNEVEMKDPMSKAISFEVNGEEVKLSGNIIREYLVSGNDDVTDQEVVNFLNLCRYQKLNPFLKEAYLIKFKGTPAQLITSKEAFMKRADAHPKYEGFEAGIVIERDGELVDIPGALLPSGAAVKGGWAQVYRNDRKKPIYVRISLAEFSKGQATWKQMPQNMIRKTAIVNALREAFPESLGAMYTEDDPVLHTQELPVEEQVRRDVSEKSASKNYDFTDEPQPEPRKEVNPANEPKQESQKTIQGTLIDEPTPSRKEYGF